MSETLYRAVNQHGNNARKLHTDRNCPQLQVTQTVREVSRETHPNEEVCRICSGEYEPHDGGDKSLNQLLKEVGPDAV